MNLPSLAYLCFPPGCGRNCSLNSSPLLLQRPAPRYLSPGLPSSLRIARTDAGQDGVRRRRSEAPAGRRRQTRGPDKSPGGEAIRRPQPKEDGRGDPHDPHGTSWRWYVTLAALPPARSHDARHRRANRCAPTTQARERRPPGSRRSSTAATW